MSLLTRFLQANRRLSQRFDRRSDLALYEAYDDEVARALSELPPGGTVVDVGAGRTCSFADRLPPTDLTIVAVDSSSAELAANPTAQRTLVADVSHRIPLPDATVDLLVSRTLLEHVPDLRSTVAEMARVTKPGATNLHLLPCRYSLFAILARVLSFPFAKRALHAMIPESRGIVEFDVYYDHTYPAAIERAFYDAGFHEVYVECTWDQTAYFHAIFPIFLLVLLYQRLIAACRLRTLASYALVRAVR